MPFICVFEIWFIRYQINVVTFLCKKKPAISNCGFGKP